jgi:HEAT repeat protein
VTSDSESVAAIRAAEAPVLKDLAAVGLVVDHVQDLYLRRFDYRAAIPVLVRWLPVVDDPTVKEMIVRGLAVRWSRDSAVPTLIHEFRTTHDESDSGYRWAVGNALEVTASKKHVKDLIEIATHQAYGRSREMVVLRLARIQDEAVVGALLSLLSDPVVAGHAVSALAKLQPPGAEPLLKPFLRDERGWVRVAAKRAIEGIQRKTKA